MLKNLGIGFLVVVLLAASGAAWGMAYAAVGVGSSMTKEVRRERSVRNGSVIVGRRVVGGGLHGGK